MTDHAELVAELARVEGMSMTERLKYAKKRRAVQLKKYKDFEKQLEKGSKIKKGVRKEPQTKNRNVKFSSSIVLLEAAARNDVAEVRNLLEQKVSPNVANSDGLTALHQCCIDNFDDMVRLLVTHGASVNAEDSESWTPLHASATCGHAKLCQFLIDKGANLLAVNADGNMPYDICDDDETLDIIESAMAAQGVTQNLIDETRLVPEVRMMEDIKSMAKAGQSLEIAGAQGETLLHVAAANGYISVVDLLLEKGVAIDTRDNEGWQPLHAATFWGHLPVVELLVSHGADLETARTTNGESPLDLCDDPDMRDKLSSLREEVRSKGVIQLNNVAKRRNSIQHRNLSVKKTMSSNDKKALSHREAQEEAKLLLNIAADQDREDDDITDGRVPVSNIDSAVVTERQAVSPSNVHVSVATSPKSPAAPTAVSPKSSTAAIASAPNFPTAHVTSSATLVVSSAATVALSAAPVASSPKPAAPVSSFFKTSAVPVAKSPATPANKAPPIAAVPSVATHTNNDTKHVQRVPAAPSTGGNAGNGAHVDSNHATAMYTSDSALNSIADDNKAGPLQQPQQGGTLADLKRRRAQQNQLNIANRRTSLDVQQNGGETSNSALFGTEPPKHRFIAPTDTQPIRPAAKAKGCCTVM